MLLLFNSMDMKRIRLYFVISLLFFFSCANVNSLVGIYHERIELKKSYKNIENNGLKTLNYFLAKDEKIDSIPNKYLLFYIFAYGCHYNEKFLTRLDSLQFAKSEINIIYCCDNLTSKKRTEKLVSKINKNVAKSLIYPKNGIKHSLHNIGLNSGILSSLEDHPNNLYLMNKKGEIIYANFSPMKKVIDTIKNIAK